MQGLFYSYIFEKPVIFYYLKDDKIEHKFEVKDAKKELIEWLNSISAVVKETDNINNCKYCEYRFVCGRE